MPYTVFYITGYILTSLGCGMLIVSTLDAVLIVDHPHWAPFLLGGCLTSFIGTSFIFAFRGLKSFNYLRVREIFLLTFISWVTLSFCAAIPLWLSPLQIPFVDAIFEMVSALTTTGATIFKKIEILPKSILLWRSILQWIGGIGISIMAITLLPILKVGGMGLFRSEFSDNSEKVLPQLSQITTSILVIYSVLTLSSCSLYFYGGMSLFDAFCHAMATVSTGGLSNYTDSFLHFNSNFINIVCIAFMYLSSLPFILYVKAFRGHSRSFHGNSQVKTFTKTYLFFTIILIFWLWYKENTDVLYALQKSAFTVMSILSTTGFTNHDYMVWGSFPAVLVFFISMIGGCTGSTSGGVKIFRFEILSRICGAHIKTIHTPHGIFKPTYNGQLIDNTIVTSVIVFLVLWAFTIFSIAFLGAFWGLDLITAISGAIATVTNVGPGVGSVIGPSGHYADLPEFVKWLYMAGMMLGRLEFLTIIVLFSFSAWRK